MTLKFGTDGVRGVAGTELTSELVTSLGRAAARVLDGGTFLVGRDTRVSGPGIQAALSAGLTAEGVDVVDLGVVPTPAVAAASAERGLPAAMISASHNPYTDNGVKFFAAGGRKLSDAVEERLEALLGAPPSGASVGRLSVEPEATAAYERRLLAAMNGRRLEGLHVVLDCANGAASTVGPEAFREAGARVEVIHDAPDGININAGCGSTHPQDLQRAVVEAGADAGLAFDGDADRVLAVDGAGRLVDGDHMMAICAIDMHAEGRLTDATVVVTVMTNLGFRLAMAERGITVVETQVGDRYVLEALEDGKWSLGGEQSGHVIFRDLATTGDGLLTGLLLLDAVHRAGRPLADLAAEAMTQLPQVLVNVRVADRAAVGQARAIKDEVAAVEAELGDHGRVLLRPSGTEPVVRVMVEAPSQQQAEQAAERLAAAVEAASTP
ncbi:MAG: phosphoglucosamine mutase [Actinomycetota bacterium]